MTHTPSSMMVLMPGAEATVYALVHEPKTPATTARREWRSEDGIYKPREVEFRLHACPALLVYVPIGVRHLPAAAYDELHMVVNSITKDGRFAGVDGTSLADTPRLDKLAARLRAAHPDVRTRPTLYDLQWDQRAGLEYREDSWEQIADTGHTYAAMPVHHPPQKERTLAYRTKDGISIKAFARWPKQSFDIIMHA